MSVKKRSEKNNLGTTVDGFISFDGNDFYSGKDGIVWATFELRQSEIIQNTLLVQGIYSEIKRFSHNKKELVLIIVTNQRDVNPAIDFIWRSTSGLRLKSDWSYPTGQNNTSFEYWLSGK